jgi:hypothetical protein
MNITKRDSKVIRRSSVGNKKGRQRMRLTKTLIKEKREKKKKKKQ